MAGKFNKIFNSTTIYGRANVAKATYASFAIMYLIYRIRKRGRSADDGGKELDCGCHGRMLGANAEEPPPSPPKGKEDCRVCRDRAAKAHKDSGAGAQAGSEHGTAATTRRRKCPCEDPHLHTDSDELTQRRESDNLSESEGCASYTPGVSLAENKPDANAMHEAIFRALRGMFGAVVGGGGSGSEHDADAAGSVATFDAVGLYKPKCETNGNEQKDNNNNNDKSRTKDDDYLDGIGPDLTCDD